METHLLRFDPLVLRKVLVKDGLLNSAPDSPCSVVRFGRRKTAEGLQKVNPNDMSSEALQNCTGQVKCYFLDIVALLNDYMQQNDVLE